MALKLLLISIVTAASLFWALRGLDPGHTWEAVSAFPLMLIPVIFALLFAGAVIRTLRLQLLLETPVSFRSTFVVMSVGVMAINIVPLRMGEFVRPYLLSSRYGVPFGQALAAIGIERLLDLVGLLMLFGLSAWLVPLPPEGILVGGVDLLEVGRRVVGIGVVAGFSALLLLLIAGDAGLRLVERGATAVLPHRVSAPALRFARSLLEGLRLLASKPSRAIRALASTVGLWGVWVLAAWAGMTGFEAIGATLPTAILNWAATVTAFMLIPTPGFLGSFEAGSVGSLVVLGTEATTAQAFAIGYHSLTFLFAVLLGAMCLPAVGAGLSETIRHSRKGPDREGLDHDDPALDAKNGAVDEGRTALSRTS